MLPATPAGCVRGWNHQPMNEQVLGHRPAGAGPVSRPAGDARIRQRVARWRAGRRILSALLTEHERGGYAVSPATWQRLRAEAARRAAPGA